MQALAPPIRLARDHHAAPVMLDDTPRVSEASRDRRRAGSRETRSVPTAAAASS
jgi:hypothetical protein